MLKTTFSAVYNLELSVLLEDESHAALVAENRLTVLDGQSPTGRLEIVRERKGRRAERSARLDGDE